MGRNISNDISSDTRFTFKKPRIPLGMVSTQILQSIVKFKKMFFDIMCFVFVNMGPYGTNIFKRQPFWQYISDPTQKKHVYS